MIVLYKILYILQSQEFNRKWTTIINSLEIGDSLAPYISINFNNGKNHIGICKVPIDSIISNDGVPDSVWFQIYNDNVIKGKVLVETSFTTKDRVVEEKVIDIQKENEV